jgi:serine/threonine protein kinase
MCCIRSTENAPGAEEFGRFRAAGHRVPGPFGGRRARVYTRRVEEGRRIGKYVLDERIAVGGMAEVWAARAEGPQGFVKPVALKFILESFSGDPELERLFVNEARIAARLQHANLVTVFDFDKVEADQERGLAGRYYIAMERVEGRDLRQSTEAARRAGYVFPLGMALYVAGEVLKALRYVHGTRDSRGAGGLVHRDVSPHNVLVGFTGDVKLSDFGIAKAREHSAPNTKPGSLRGKIAYASPEQLSGLAVDHRTDQFAAGVTIWELLAGRKLFDGASDLEIIGKVARCEIPAFAALPAPRDVPPAVEAVVRRMLAADANARFPTTGDALSAVLALPGYSPDGAPLGELMRALFTSSRVDLLQTQPILSTLVAPSVAAAAAPTRTMQEGLVSEPAAAHKTPTRVAARTSEVLARSPAAVPPGPTVDVRAERRGAKLVGAVVLGALVAAGVLARKQLGVGAAKATAPSVSLEPPAASPAPVSPPPSPAPSLPIVKPAVAEPSVAEPAVAEPSVAEPAAHGPAVAGPAVAPTPVAGRGTHGARGDRRRGARRHHAEAVDDAPVVTPPAPVPEPPPRAAPNGAPIIE